MNKELAFGAGLGIGTIVMYLLDPDRGKRRRALMGDKFLWAQRKTGDCIEVTARDLSNRARGIATTIQSRFTSDDADDAVLIDRVRSKLGRLVSHPGAIEVAVENGHITLSGPILEDEVAGLLSYLKWTKGVNDVNNNLEVHKEAGNHPALQGRARPAGLSIRVSSRELVASSFLIFNQPFKRSESFSPRSRKCIPCQS